MIAFVMSRFKTFRIGNNTKGGIWFIIIVHSFLEDYKLQYLMPKRGVTLHFLPDVFNSSEEEKLEALLAEKNERGGKYCKELFRDLESSFPPKRFWAFYSGQCLLSKIDEETLECSSNPLLAISSQQIRTIRDKLEYIDDEFVAKVPVRHLLKILDVLEKGREDRKKCDQELLLYAPISTQLYDLVKVNRLTAYSILFIILMGVMRRVHFFGGFRDDPELHDRFMEMG